MYRTMLAAVVMVCVITYVAISLPDFIWPAKPADPYLQESNLKQSYFARDVDEINERFKQGEINKEQRELEFNALVQFYKKEQSQLKIKYGR